MKPDSTGSNVNDIDVGTGTYACVYVCTLGNGVLRWCLFRVDSHATMYSG